MHPLLSHISAPKIGSRPVARQPGGPSQDRPLSLTLRGSSSPTHTESSILFTFPELFRGHDHHQMEEINLDDAEHAARDLTSANRRTAHELITHPGGPALTRPLNVLG